MRFKKWKASVSQKTSVSSLATDAADHGCTWALTCFAALCVCCGCSRSREFASRKDIESEFQQELGFKPSQNVRDLHCRMVAIGDTWGEWFSLSYDQATFQQMTNGFSLASNGESWSELWQYDLRDGTPNSPTWWPRPTNIARIKVYYKTYAYDITNNSQPGFRYFWSDSDSHLIYYRTATWR